MYNNAKCHLPALSALFHGAKVNLAGPQYKLIDGKHSIKFLFLREKSVKQIHNEKFQIS